VRLNLRQLRVAIRELEAAPDDDLFVDFPEVPITGASIEPLAIVGVERGPLSRSLVLRVVRASSPEAAPGASSTRRPPGSILQPEAYAQSKMLEHGSWYPQLPRGITPSDIDVWYADGAWFLLCENKRIRELPWTKLPKGQRMAYEDLVGATRGQALAVLWCHNVPVDEPVDSMLDCESFIVLSSAGGRPPRFTARLAGSMWPGFVALWYASPQKMRDACVELARTTPQEDPSPDDEGGQLTLGGL
jgi:hypothetical protein